MADDANARAATPLFQWFESLRARVGDRNIWIILIGIFVVGIAYGLALAFVSPFLDRAHYSAGVIGDLAAWNAVGVIAFALPAGWLTRKTSAKTTLLVSLLGYGVTIAVFPFLVDNLVSISAVRFVDGAFSVGIFAACETQVLMRAEDDNKAFLTTLYAIFMALGYIVGPVLGKLTLRESQMAYGFIAAGVIAWVTALAFALQLSPDRGGVFVRPSGASADARGSTRAAREGAAADDAPLLWRIKMPCFATFCTGYFQISTILFLPLYFMHEKGFARDETWLIPAFYAAGLVLFSNYAGRLGDRFGHLLVTRGLALGGVLATFLLIPTPNIWVAGVVILAAGGCLASISPLSLALQGAIARSDEYARANALFNVFYAIGTLVGPKLGSVVYETYGGVVFTLHLAVLWSMYVVVSLLFRRDDPAAREESVRVPA